MPLIITIDSRISGWISVFKSQYESIQSLIFSNLNSLENLFKNESLSVIGVDIPVILSKIDTLRSRLICKKIIYTRIKKNINKAFIQ